MNMQVEMNPPLGGNPSLPIRPAKPDWGEVWKVTRAILVVWAAAVWILLVLLPGIGQIDSMEAATLHLPYVLMGLVLVGGVLAAYSLRADRHLLWFLGVLLMLAGWI